MVCEASVASYSYKGSPSINYQFSGSLMDSISGRSFYCVRPAHGECRTENFLKRNGRKKRSILFPAPSPIDLPSVNLERVRLRSQSLYILLQLRVQIIRQEDDVALPGFIELRPLETVGN
jgi:hypothetical protein